MLIDHIEPNMLFLFDEAINYNHIFLLVSSKLVPLHIDSAEFEFGLDLEGGHQLALLVEYWVRYDFLSLNLGFRILNLIESRPEVFIRRVRHNIDVSALNYCLLNLNIVLVLLWQQFIFENEEGAMLTVQNAFDLVYNGMHHSYCVVYSLQIFEELVQDIHSIHVK